MSNVFNKGEFILCEVVSENVILNIISINNELFNIDGINWIKLKLKQNAYLRIIRVSNSKNMPWKI